jgi:NADP-dependent aldehyde dehydrogenase
VRTTRLVPVVAATAAAGEAFASESSRRTFADGLLLREVAQALEAQRADLCEVAGTETRLSDERLQGELTRTTRQLLAFADLADSGAWLDPIVDQGDTDAVPPRPDQRRLNVPIGPVAVFPASNFPFAFGVAGGDTASAFATGCPVVIKGHPGHPQTSRLLASCVDAGLQAAGAPAAWFALVNGTDHATSAALVEARQIEAVAFTGSRSGGLALARIAAERSKPIPVYAEMGSSNPLFVTSSAAAARSTDIAIGLAASVANSSGQLCTKPGVVFVVDDAPGHRLVARLEEELRAHDGADMLDARTFTGFNERLAEVSSDSRTHVLIAPPDGRPGWQSPALLEVQASALVSGDSLLDEIFGPAALVVWVKDDLELVASSDLVEGSLTATVHAEANDAITSQLLAALARRAGRLIVNGFPTGVTVGWATMHGGPFPSSASSAHTSVGLTAFRRFARPIGYQSVPDSLLPPALQDANPLGLLRLVDGEPTREPVVR